MVPARFSTLDLHLFKLMAPRGGGLQGPLWPPHCSSHTAAASNYVATGHASVFQERPTGAGFGVLEQGTSEFSLLSRGQLWVTSVGGGLALGHTGDI